MALVNIEGIPKGVLLIALSKGTYQPKPTQVGFLNDNGIDVNQAEKLATSGRIDYYNGRAIKTDLREDKVSPVLYDRDAGFGKFAVIVANLRVNYPLPVNHVESGKIEGQLD